MQAPVTLIQPGLERVWNSAGHKQVAQAAHTTVQGPRLEGAQNSAAGGAQSNMALVATLVCAVAPMIFLVARGRGERCKRPLWWQST